jgi:hypothetical protein
MGFLRAGIPDILRRQPQLLDDLFGHRGHQIVASEDDLVRVRTAWMELLLVYDSRDQFVSSSVKPLSIPHQMPEDHSTDTLLRFLDVEVGVRRKGALDEQQVTDELNLVRPLVRLLKDARQTRDAVCFVNGYNAAYTDYCSGKWSSD